MERVLMVPVHLDALHVVEPVPVVGPTLPYWHLPHHLDGRARNSDVPFLASALARHAFHESGQRLAPGVHLHWSMPDALTKQDATGRFPPLPDRWVIRRSGGGLPTRTWLIEADAVRHVERVDGPAACIPWYDDPDGDAPFAWLGVTAEITDATGDETPSLHAGLRLDPLTTMVGGEVTFAALYSRCGGVFGWHDAELADIGPTVPGSLVYFLYGYHASADHDPVARLRPKGRRKRSEPVAVALRAKLAWDPDVEDPTRAVYFAVTDFPDGTPAEDPAPGVVEVVEVAVGNTTIEALAAFEADHDTDMEAVLAAMRFLAESGPVATDLDHALAEFRHGEGFHAIDGGRRWMLRPIVRPDETQPAEPPAADLGPMLRALVDAERAYDDAVEQIRSLRTQLFADWCRYLACSYPHEGARLADFPDIDEVREMMGREVLDPLEALVRLTGRIEWVDRGEHEHTRPTVARDAPGRLAMLVGEHWHQLSETLDRLPGGPTHELVLAPGPRYFAPRELSVVVRGPGVEPSIRHREDGRLDEEGRLQCTSMDLAGPDARRADRDAVFAWLQERFELWTLGETPSIAFSRIRRQPWHPLVLEWDARYEALAHERPAGGHGPYPPGFVTSHFVHHPHRPDLEHVDAAPAAGPHRSGVVPISGWSLLTRGASPVLAGAIDRYLKELVAHAAEEPAVVDRLRAILARLEAPRPELSATLSGFDDALLMYRRGPQLPVRDPLALPGSVYTAFAERVARGLVQPPGSAPDPDYEFHPLRTGWLRLDELRLVDNFGRPRTLTFHRVVSADTLPVVHGDDHAFLPPRLLTPARLRTRWLGWLDAGAVPAGAVPSAADAVEVVDHDDSTPADGWLVISRLDERILVYDGDGSRLGAVELDGDHASWVALDRPVVDPILAGVIDRLSGDRDDFVQFVAAMAEAQELIDPADAGHHRALALLVGRPIAVVRCSLALDLAGEAPHSQSWHAFERTVAGLGRERSGLDEVEFPVRLGAPPPDDGRLPRLDDGLLGFWLDAERTLRTPKSTVTAAHLAPHDSATFPPEVRVSAAGGPTDVTMLLDPRGRVHAISGVLPTARLALDPAVVARALATMEVTVRAGPILTRPGHIDHLESSDPDVAWTWADHEATRERRPVEALDAQTPIPGELELRDGFLVLAPEPRGA